MSTELALTASGETIFDFSTFEITSTLDYGALGLALAPGLLDLIGTDLGVDLPELLTSSVGDISISSGVFTASLQLPDGSLLAGSLDIPASLVDLADLALNTSGSLTLADGILDVSITAGDQSYVMTGFDLAATVVQATTDVLASLSISAPVENGVVAFSLDTPGGPALGSVDLGNGNLALTLTSAYGDLAASLDFGPDAVIPFSVPVGSSNSVDGAVDFDSGNILVSLGFLGEVAIPISELDGDLTLQDGTATFTTTVPALGSLQVSFDLAPMVSDYVAGLVQSVNADVNVTNGLVEAAVLSPFGDLNGSVDLVDLTLQGADFFAGVDGTIGLDQGIATVDLTTPLNTISQVIDFTALAGLPEPVAA